MELSRKGENKKKNISVGCGMGYRKDYVLKEKIFFSTFWILILKRDQFLFLYYNFVWKRNSYHLLFQKKKKTQTFISFVPGYTPFLWVRQRCLWSLTVTFLCYHSQWPILGYSLVRRQHFESKAQLWSYVCVLRKFQSSGPLSFGYWWLSQALSSAVDEQENIARGLV